MKIIALCNDKNNVESLFNTNADIIGVGYIKFSDKTQCKLDKQEIQNALNLSKSKNKQLFIYLDEFIYDSMINELEDLLIYLNKIKVDGIIFNDLAIAQICYEKNIKINLLYDPKALITNYEQFPFYKKNNINTLVLANELKYIEIEQCLKNKNGIQLAKQVSGYVFMMESRWQLITQFLNKNKITANLNNRKVFIKEETRQFPAIIYQNEQGTHMFTGYVLTNMNYLKQYKENNLDFIIIDGLLHSDNWLNKTIEIYHEAINDLNNLDKYKEQEIEINKDEFISCGFCSSKLEDLKYAPENAKEEQ